MKKDFLIENERDLNYLPKDNKIETIRHVRNNQDLSENKYRKHSLDL